MNISETKKCYVYGQCQVRINRITNRWIISVKKHNKNEHKVMVKNPWQYQTCFHNVSFLQEYSLDFKATQDAEGGHKFCGKNEECNWWSWEPAFELCMLFANCTEVGIDPPAVEPCPECISGEKGLVQNEKSNMLTNFLIICYALCQKIK